MTIAEAFCCERLRYEEHGALGGEGKVLSMTLGNDGGTGGRTETALYIYNQPHTIQRPGSNTTSRRISRVKF
jgi:hypothetical protein